MGGWGWGGLVGEGLEDAPGAAVAGEEGVGFGGAPGAGLVGADGWRGGIIVPSGFDEIDEAPGAFDFVAAGEEGGIAAHGIEEEAFVGFRGGFPEAGAVMEVHFDGFDAEGTAGEFALHAEGDAFVWLDANDEDIGAELFGAFVKEDAGGIFELDGDFGGAFGEAFSDADVEGDAVPAPVIDIDLEGDVSFGGGGGGDAIFGAVGFDGGAADGADIILGADDIVGDIGRGHGAEGADDFDFFVADAIGGEIGGGFHGDEAEELEEMILDHIAEGASAFVVGATGFDAEGFGGGDLDMIDVAVIPEGLEDFVGEAEDHDILGGLFAEEMVDAEGLAFGEGFANDGVEIFCGGEVSAEGFFDDHAGPGAVGGFVEASVGEVLEDAFEFAGGDGEIEEAIALGAAFGVEGIEAFGEAGVAGGVSEFALVVEEAIGEAGPDGIIDP